jgi:MFS family permease
VTATFVGLLFVAGNLSSGIYPLYVSSIIAIGRATPSNVGVLATAEFLPFGLAIIVAGRFLQERRLRLVAGLCLAVQLSAGFATTKLPFAALVPCRALFGIAGGILIWISYAYLARSEHAGRLVALYTTALMTVGVAWSWIAPSLVMPEFGSTGIILFLVVPSLLALLLLSFGPDDLASLPQAFNETEGKDHRGWLPTSALLILLSVGSWSMFMTIFWVYSEPLAAQHPGNAIQHWLTVSLTCQILGSAMAAPLAERVSYRLILTVGLLLSIVQVLSIILGVSGAGFLGWTAVFGFLGWFLWPFFVAALADLDQSRRSIVYLPAAQNLAGSIGPLVVSQMVSETDLSAGLIVDLIAIGVAPAMLWAALLVHSRSKQKTRPSAIGEPRSSTANKSY